MTLSDPARVAVGANAAAGAALGDAAPERTGSRRSAPARAALAVTALAAVALVAFAAATAHHRSRAAALAPAGPVRIDALRCGEATLAGDGASPELARAIGIGACARLAIEVGVAWGRDLSAPKLDVASTIASNRAEVTLSVAGRSARARAGTPLDAISAAVSELGRELSPPPATPEQVTAWGARDGAGARRIERVFHRMHFNLDIRADAERLKETDPESPWTWRILASDMAIGTAEAKQAIRQILDRASVLPSARSSSLKGVLLCRAGTPIDRREALLLLERSYAESPDDIVVVSNYIDCLMNSASPEMGFAIVDRLWERQGAGSLLAIIRALRAQEIWGYWDLDWNRKQMNRLHEILPESRAWRESIKQKMYQGQIDEARAALELAEQLGYGGSTTDDEFRLFPARVALAALEPAAARAMASRLLGEPKYLAVIEASTVIFFSHLMEGRITDALSIGIRETERFRRHDNMVVPGLLSALALAPKRWTGVPPPPPEDLDEAERVLTAMWMNLNTAYLLVEVGVARARRGPAGKAAARSTLTTFEGLIDTAHGGGRPAWESTRLLSLPLARVVRGDQEAVRLWRQSERATSLSRSMVAFDAGIVLEATGDLAGAEEAYRLAHGSAMGEWATFQPVAARLRLARLYRQQGRIDEAVELESVVDRLWAKADPGLRDAVLKLR